MTTYRELIYMCLDLLKGMGDDFTYTEDHVAYLLDKFRALLLKQRYGNDPKKLIPYSNYQNINIEFSLSAKERYLKILTNNSKIPYMLQLGIPRLIKVNDNYHTEKYEYVSRERFKFTGKNKYLKNITYFTIDNNNILLTNKDEYWTTIVSNTTYIGPTDLTFTGIFESPRDIVGEDFLDADFPIEESLITTLIEMVVKELLGASYRPADDKNDNNDALSDIASFISRNMKSQFQKQIE